MKSSSPTASVKEEVEIKKKVKFLLKEAINTYRAGRFSDAFSAISQVKTYRVPVQHIDYFRAACLLHLGRPIDARDALRDELHYFPTNSNASTLLQEVLEVAPDVPQIQDVEFKKIYSLVRPYTMIPEARLHSLFTLAKDACRSDLPGNFVECGIAHGGTSLMLGTIINKYGKGGKHLFGLNIVRPFQEGTEFDETNINHGSNDISEDDGPNHSEDRIKEVAQNLGIDHVITVCTGDFGQLVGTSLQKIGTISFLHVNVTGYLSTKTILDNLYDNVLPDGYIQLNDYGLWQGCKKALDEFQANHNLSFDLQAIPGDTKGIWMRKP